MKTLRLCLAEINATLMILERMNGAEVVMRLLEQIRSAVDDAHLIMRENTKVDPYMKSRIVEYLSHWYLTNFEPIEESTPRDNGDWVYVWGEPISPLEALQEQFSDLFNENLIETVAKKLEEEHEIYEWVPKPVYGK